MMDLGKIKTKLQLLFTQSIKDFFFPSVAVTLNIFLVLSFIFRPSTSLRVTLGYFFTFQLFQYRIEICE